MLHQFLQVSSTSSFTECEQDNSPQVGQHIIVCVYVSLKTNLMPIEDYISELTNWDRKDNKDRDGE